MLGAAGYLLAVRPRVPHAVSFQAAAAPSARDGGATLAAASAGELRDQEHDRDRGRDRAADRERGNEGDRDREPEPAGESDRAAAAGAEGSSADSDAGAAAARIVVLGADLEAPALAGDLAPRTVVVETLADLEAR